MTDPASRELLAQARYLTESAGLRARDELRVVRVQGEDRDSWLNGQITADVRGASEREAVYGLVIDIKGRILTDLWVTRTQRELVLLLPASSSDAVLAHLQRYIIMEDVVLAPDDAARVLSVQGPRAHDVGLALRGVHPVVAADELGTGGWLAITTATAEPALRARLAGACQTAGGGEVTGGAFELARLRRGVPRCGADFDDGCYPQEAGLKRALSFSKGCYLGQEVVCVLEHRGRVSRRLCKLTARGRFGGASLVALLGAGGETCGQLRSHVFDPEQERTHALGYVKRSNAEPGTVLTAADTSFTLEHVVGDIT